MACVGSGPNKGNSGPQGLEGPNVGNLGGVAPFMGGSYDDIVDAAIKAAPRAGASGNASYFTNILKSIADEKPEVTRTAIDEKDAIEQHKKYFSEKGDSLAVDSRGVGGAAAMQALKLFLSGEMNGKQSGGEFVVLAMKEASKLFDEKETQGKIASSKKEEAVKEAAKLALKMCLGGQGSASSSSNSSGLGGLANHLLG